MLSSLLQLLFLLLVFDGDCFPLHKILIPIASHDFLTKSEWDTIMSLLLVLSFLEIATRILSGVDYPSLYFTFVVFDQTIQSLDDVLKSFLISSYYCLASSLNTFVLEKNNNLKNHNGTSSFLSMSVDPRF